MSPFLPSEQDEEALLAACKEAYVPKPCEDNPGSFCEGLENFCSYESIKTSCKMTCGLC